MKRPKLQVFERGIARDVEPESRIITIAEWNNEIAPALVAFFNDPHFPNAAVPATLGIEEVKETALPDGGTMCSCEIMLKGKNDWNWFTTVGVVAKVLAENIGGAHARKVSMVVHHADEFMFISLEIHAKSV